jgi:hypothetical protein
MGHILKNKATRLSVRLCANGVASVYYKIGPCVHSRAEPAGMEFAGFGAGPGWNRLSGLLPDRLASDE